MLFSQEEPFLICIPCYLFVLLLQFFNSLSQGAEADLRERRFWSLQASWMKQDSEFRPVTKNHNGVMESSSGLACDGWQSASPVVPFSCFLPEGRSKGHSVVLSKHTSSSEGTKGWMRWMIPDHQQGQVSGPKGWLTFRYTEHREGRGAGL